MRACRGGDVLHGAIGQHFADERDLPARGDKGASALTEPPIAVRLIVAEMAFIPADHMRGPRGFLLDVHVPETSQPDPAARVLRVKTAAIAAVVRHAELLDHDLVLAEIPGKNALRVPAIFRHPQFAIRPEGKPSGIHHALRIIRSAIRAASFAYHGQCFAIG